MKRFLRFDQISHNRPTALLLQKKTLFAAALAVSFVIPGAALALQSSSDNNSSTNSSSLTESKSPDPSSTDTSLPNNARDGDAKDTSQSLSIQSDINVSVPPTASGGSSDASVKVNGQNIPVPENGRIRKQIDSSNGKTQIDVQVDNNSSASSYSSSSTNISVDSYSSSSSNDTSARGGRSAPHR